jgi:hypothetical protein
VVEALFSLIGSWLYSLILILLEPRVPSAVFAFAIGYLFVALVDLWRCWRCVQWRRCSLLELIIAVLITFPIGSALWLPWDIHRAYGAGSRAQRRA